ncbi:MAG: MFS transporter [Candidatus Carbobacillus altaicus]|uniref:Major facilitator family transporter n=1 Tax=Candidatus Carbonibacillus altaicus TaxID=2163959 RepID=A0A2R6Y218_9BACL|nr:MFS transporter [Candidatus Carbobacillus altaicus]PTQ56730.1 MAG: Major facilitator family transporter [Candidatus Carbobacillus altaicus]
MSSPQSMPIAEKNPSRRNALWTKTFLLITVANFFHFLGFQLLLSTIPIYAQDLGAKETDIGLVVSMLTLFALLIRPLTGGALDLYGKKRLLLIGLALNLLAILLYPFARGLSALFLIRALHGIGFGISTTAFGTIAADIVPPARRGEGLGIFGLSTTLSMAIGPYIGLLLYDRTGTLLLFTASALMTITSMIMVIPLSRTEIDLSRPVKKHLKEALSLPEMFEGKAAFPALLVMLLSLSYGGIIAFLTPYGKSAGVPNIGVFFIFNAIFVFLSRPFAGRIYDVKGVGWILLPGALSGMIGLWLLAHATTTWTVIVAASFYGLAFGSIQPSLQAWANDRAPLNKRGAANAMFFSAFDLGIGGGAIALGWIAAWLGYAKMYECAGVLFILMIGLFFAHTGRRRAASEKGAT